MKLFISYARVDKPYCSQIVETLNVHEVWYDQRLHAGQQWWDEIQRRLHWCEGFVYLLSPDSVKSEYCQKELSIALSLGKHVFPVLIHLAAQIPESLAYIQYADLSQGLTAEAVKQLLNSIYITEKMGAPKPIPQPVAISNKPADINPNTVIDEIAEAMETSNYDRAVFLLKQVRADGYESRFIKIDVVLREAEAALERQAYLREAEREYRPIVALVKRARTRELGFRAFSDFHGCFPDYDPENLAAMFTEFTLPTLEWSSIPAGEVTIEHKQKQIIYYVNPFQMSTYPITNAQFQVFINSADGYSNPKWWTFGSGAYREQKLLPTKFSWGNHPRANISWYEAMAFCNWLSEKTNSCIRLPTEQQWQFVAQGGDGRLYPWGDKFEKTRCNSKESKLQMTTPVNKYDGGVSPFGVYDMAGNVWEWCLNQPYGASSNGHKNHQDEELRAVRGGAFISVAQRASTKFHFYLSPLCRYTSIGFRVVKQ